MKRRFVTEIKQVKVCPCCGQRTERVKLSDGGEPIVCAMMTFNTDGNSLIANAWTPTRCQELQAYEDAIAGLDELTTVKLSDLAFEFSDAFVFIDPPYIRSTATAMGEFIGSRYTVSSGGDNWLPSDDARLVDWVRKHANGQNIFVLFGSQGNNLERLVLETFEVQRREELTYRQNTFGKLGERREWLMVTDGSER